MLTLEELRALRDGSFDVDCPSIVLQRNSPTGPIRVEGAGSIFWSGDGLIFKLFGAHATEQADVLDEILLSRIQPGKLIPEDAFYSLTARDWKGREWRSSHILPSFTIGESLILRGRIREMEQVEQLTQGYLATPTHSLTFHIFHPLDFPRNESTLTYKKTTASQEERLVRGELNRASINVEGNQFVLTEEEGHVSLHVRLDPSESCRAAALRVVEAMQFVLGQSLEWTVMYERVGDHHITRIRSTRGAAKRGRLEPPLSFNVGGPPEVWGLFGRFFRYICRYEDEHRFHPISAWINSVRTASAGTVNAQALALCVAVEGILKAEFPELGSPAQEFQEAVRQLVRYVDEWPGPEDVKKRAQSVLGSLVEPRAIDRLRALASDGSISENLIEAWRTLRNRSVHADPVQSEELEELLNLCDRVTVLMYQIIFRAIGYTGPYTDYTTMGWPVREYPKDNSLVGGDHVGLGDA